MLSLVEFNNINASLERSKEELAILDMLSTVSRERLLLLMEVDISSIFFAMSSK